MSSIPPDDLKLLENCEIDIAIGRLLEVYESIYNHRLFQMLETVYKKRIILEEIQELAKTTNILCTEISFPLEFVMFSKIKRRNALYPNASYSYFKIYAGE